MSSTTPQEPDLQEINNGEALQIFGLFVLVLVFLLVLRILCILVIDICILRDMNAARRSLRGMLGPCLYCGHFLCGYEMDEGEIAPPRPETMQHDSGIPPLNEQSKLGRLLSELSAEKKDVLFSSILQRQNGSTDSTDGQTVIDVDEESQDSDSPNSNVCSICLDVFDDDTDTVVSPKTCNHKFHETCILSWLEKHVDCPNCRIDMITEADVLSVVKEEEEKESADSKKNSSKNKESRTRFVRTL